MDVLKINDDDDDDDLVCYNYKAIILKDNVTIDCSFLQQAGRNPTNRMLSKYWTEKTGRRKWFL